MKRPVTQAVLWLSAFIVLFLYRTLYSFDNRHITTFLLCCIDVSLFFGSARLCNAVLVPKLLYKRRYVLFAASVIGLMAGCIAAMQLLQQLLYRATTALCDDAYQILRQFSYQIFNSWLVIALGILCILSYRLLGDHLVSERRYQELQKEQAQTELKFLKAQINPHFLFNSINSIYAHIDKSNSDARDMVLRFSQMLRYQLYECNAEQIDIQKELAYLQDYVALQRLRKEETLDVSLTTDGVMQGFDIAPLLLIPFVENAFKYVSTHDNQPNTLRIALSREGEQLQFYCYNTKDSVVSRSLPQDKGIGIVNVRRRLELIYPSRHRLEIENKEAYFEVRLQLQLS